MSKLFGGMTNDGLEETQDRLGGSFLLDTDAYDATVDMAYAITSAKGANGMVFNFKAGGKDYRETVWFTNVKGENFFLNRDDQTKKVPLPGYTVVNDICLAATEKPLNEQDFEEKTINVYDYDLKKEVPTVVQVAVELLGKPVTLGIVRNLENKTVKNESTGKYDATPEEKEVNVISKVFHTESRKSMVEALNGQDATFYDKWVAKNRGQVFDRREIKDGAGTAGRPTAGGAPAAGAGKAAPKSLFGNKS